jgi:hypothetical protein
MGIIYNYHQSCVRLFASAGTLPATRVILYTHAHLSGCADDVVLENLHIALRYPFMLYGFINCDTLKGNNIYLIMRPQTKYRIKSVSKCLASNVILVGTAECGVLSKQQKTVLERSVSV